MLSSQHRISWHLAKVIAQIAVAAKLKDLHLLCCRLPTGTHVRHNAVMRLDAGQQLHLLGKLVTSTWRWLADHHLRLADTVSLRHVIMDMAYAENDDKRV